VNNIRRYKMQRVITLTDKQEEVLAVYVEKTGRSVEELIVNFLEGWIGQLESQINESTYKKSEINEKIDLYNEDK
jgi:hypothetical protein